MLENLNAKILIVDDLAENIDFLEKVLDNPNWEVISANDGWQAIDLLEKHSFDLILLDIMMPELNGFEACTLIKQKEKYKDLPIIFLTSLKEEKNILQGFKLGAVDYINKPFNSLELLARVKTHLKLKQTISSLKDALKKVKQLSGLLPICSHCANIRKEDGDWQELDSYIMENTSAQFSHGICPNCLKVHYPDICDSVLEKQRKEEN